MNPTYKLNNPLIYADFKELVITLAAKGSCTGEKTQEHISATKINAQRIKRIDKQLMVSEPLKNELNKLKNNWTWIVLIESWCGDGAQNLPIINKIVENSSNIKLTIILRDENFEIMDGYLTNGSRAIPKLICYNTDTNKEIGSWGPRPKNIMEMVKEYKIQNPSAPHDEFVKNLHLWYAKDKGESLQSEFIDLLTVWNS